MKNNTNNAANTSPVETKAEFARRLGVNRSTVTRGVQQGRIIVNGAGLVYINESLKRWNDTKAGRFDVEARHAQNRGHAIQFIDTSAPISDDTMLESAADGVSILKAIALNARNEKSRIEIKLSSGELILREQHAYECARFGNQFKQGIQQLIDNLVPVLAGVTDDVAMSRIDQQINELIARLS